MGSLGLVEVLILLPIILITLSLPLILIYGLVQQRQLNKRLEAVEAELEKIKDN